MTKPLVSDPENSIYRSYWKQAPKGANEQLFTVVSAVDFDLEAGYEPTAEATFDKKSDAEAYIAKWAPLYPMRLFYIV